MSKIITDFVGYLKATPELIKESEEKNNGRLFLSGVLQRADTKNENNRIYPRGVLEREAEKFQKKINEGLSYGELDHPDSPVVELKNTSHAIRKLWWKDDELMGTFEIFDTPMGKIVKEILSKNMQIANSSRGVGSTKQTNEGLDEVQEDFELITFDIVSNPSTFKAYLNPVHESKEYNKKNKIYMNINNIINDILRR